MKVKLLKEVENIVLKGEIACFEQFLLLPECFQKSSAADASESIYNRKRVNHNNFKSDILQMHQNASELR